MQQRGETSISLGTQIPVAGVHAEHPFSLALESSQSVWEVFLLGEGDRTPPKSSR